MRPAADLNATAAAAASAAAAAARIPAAAAQKREGCWWEKWPETIEVYQ